MEEGNYSWECKCGRVEFKEYPPEECETCWKLNSFTKKETTDIEDNILEDLE